MKWIRVPVLAGCFALALSVSPTWAQQGTTPGSGQTGGSASTSGSQAQANDSGTANGKGNDKKFVKAAMEGGMAEVKLGQMATEKGNSQDVKQFGQKMVDDHTKLNDQMKPICSQMGLTPASDLSPKDKALQAKLEGLSGDAFDKAYMSAMVKDHRKDLKEFNKEASSGKDPQVKDAAQQGAQVIQQHLELAEQVAQKVGAAGGKMGKNAKSSNTSSSTPGTPSTTNPQ